MNTAVLIAGSGKIARNAGAYFLGKGCRVTWVCRQAEPPSPSVARLERDIRRALRTAENAGTPAQVFAYGDARLRPAPVLLECVTEEAGIKRAALARLDPLISPETLVLSSSSSILPAEIHARCLGLHFFYPVELTGLVEVVVPDGCPESLRRRTRRFAETAGLTVLEEDARTAFAGNRLTLTMQAECFRALAAGFDAPAVDAASASVLTPVGQLAWMDAIGLDVIAPAVENYLRRMEPDAARALTPLRDGLRLLLARGKLGKKNGNGLLCGDALPWTLSGRTEDEVERLRQRLFALFLNDCYSFLESGQLKREGLDLLLQSVFGAERSLEEAAAGSS